MTAELVQWLHKQLDDDERIARACPGDGKWTTLDIAIYDGRLRADVREHVARHDPVRVLAEVDSKRRTIARINAHAAVMGWDEVHGDLLRLLALPYANRPGYRDEWRP